MFRRSSLKFVGVALPAAVIALIGFSSVSFAQDKPADKPAAEKPKADKPQDKPAPQPADKPADKPKAEEPKAKDIVDMAMGAGNCKTLCDLLKAAKLDTELKGAGPFTVFAPSDEAFAKIDKKSLDDWKKPENEKKLRDILNYHIVKGKNMAADVAKMKTAKSMQGGELTIATKDGKTMVGTATITKADVAASNGVIHIIDVVLMPAEGAKPEKKEGH
jgi:uncharacterized surface protein with fasciclin (FAS1) repeats